MTRVVKIQLLIFTVLTLIALTALGWYYLRLPSVAGVGQYTLYAELPRSGGLYSTANVTYRGTTIGKVTDVVPTERGALATMSIGSEYKIPEDASANVHSVSAVGEQYLDLVPGGNSKQKFFSAGQTIKRSNVPSEIGPALDNADKTLKALPKEKIDSLLTETSEGLGGLGPALQRLVESTSNIATGLTEYLPQIDDVIEHSSPIIDSQVQTGDAISRWSRNLNDLASQTAQQDQAVRSLLRQAAPTASQVNGFFNDVRETLPQTLANVAVVTDLLKRNNKGVEQSLVIFPQLATTTQMTLTTNRPGTAAIPVVLSINQPPPCFTGFLPASEWRSPADLSPHELPDGLYCKIPQDTPGNAVRAARNYPCADFPGKRRATPAECRSPEPYTPAGTNPWYGDPNQVLTCPAPAARCDQPVKPGYVIPAPTINNGTNPLPANLLPPPTSRGITPSSDPLTAPGQGTVTCSGQQPNPCTYTPTSGPVAVYNPSSGEVTGPDGVKYSVNNSSNPGESGWKEMLAPASSPAN